MTTTVMDIMALATMLLPPTLLWKAVPRGRVTQELMSALALWLLLDLEPMARGVSTRWR